MTATRVRALAVLAVVGAVAIAGAGGCTEKGRSLVTISVTADATIGALALVDLQITQGGAVLRSIPGEAWTASPLRLQIYLPKEVTGQVKVVAYGYAADGAGLAVPSAASTGLVDVAPGAVTATVIIDLVAGTPPPRAGGGAGTGGRAGGPDGGGTGGLGGGADGGADDAPGGGTGGIAGTGGATGTGGGGVAGAGGGGGPGTGGTGTGGAVGPSWRGAGFAEDDGPLEDFAPKMAVDARGNAVVVYEHGSYIWTNRYDAGTGAWGTARVIDGRVGIPVSPAVAVDAAGEWLAVWSHPYDSATPGVWSATSTDGVSWTSPERIQMINAFSPVLAMNRTGAAVVAWTQNVGNLFSVAASVRRNGTWGPPTVLRPGDDTGNRYVSVAIGGTGEAFVGWEQDDGGTADELSAWMSRNSAGGTGAWSPAELVESYDLGQAYAISVAANDTGQAVLTWLQGTEQTVQLLSRRTAQPGVFGAPEMLTEAGGIDWRVSPPVTIDPAGNTTVAYSVLAAGRYNVYASRARAGQPWGTAMALETDNEATATNAQGPADSITTPQIGSDDAGNVTVIWRKRSGTRFDVWARRFGAAAGSWSPAAAIETQDSTSVFGLALGVGSGGTAAATWYHGSEFRIWANILR